MPGLGIRFLLTFGLICLSVVPETNSLEERLISDGTFKVWDPTNMSQHDFMHKDECILVDKEDNPLGHASKYKAHQLDSEFPSGRLHRAFSVFLFDLEGRLLLQQRAASKITFPNVWTNTCCSHQLYGYHPSELDSQHDIEQGSVPGAKHAAQRKLEHEFGIPRKLLPVEGFRYLTRLHYAAADTVTHGVNATWGEHEMDYILFFQAQQTLELKLDPEEIQAVRWVSHTELLKMMEPSSGLLWSPWFRIIVKEFLSNWWANLTKTIETTDFVDVATVHRFQM